MSLFSFLFRDENQDLVQRAAESAEYWRDQCIKAEADRDYWRDLYLTRAKTPPQPRA